MLTKNESRTLLYLACVGGEPSIEEMAWNLGLSEDVVGPAVDAHCEAGRAEPADAESRRYRITPAGHRAVDSL